MIIIPIFFLLLEITLQKEVDFTYFCANVNCSEPISEAKVRVRIFTPRHELQLRVQSGEEVEIYEKSKECNQYKVKLKKSQKEGFLPRNILNEGKVYAKYENLVPVIRTLPENLNENLNSIKSTVNENISINKTIQTFNSKNKLSSSRLEVFLNILNITNASTCSVKSVSNFLKVDSMSQIKIEMDNSKVHVQQSVNSADEIEIYTESSFNQTNSNNMSDYSNDVSNTSSNFLENSKFSVNAINKKPNESLNEKNEVTTEISGVKDTITSNDISERVVNLSKSSLVKTDKNSNVKSNELFFNETNFYNISNKKSKSNLSEFDSNFSINSINQNLNASVIQETGAESEKSITAEGNSIKNINLIKPIEDSSSDNLNHKSTELSHSETNSANVIAEKNLSDLNMNTSKFDKNSSDNSINRQYDEMPVQINETAKEISDSGDAITSTNVLEVVTVNSSKPNESETEENLNVNETPFYNTSVEESKSNISKVDSNFSINSINQNLNASVIQETGVESEKSITAEDNSTKNINLIKPIEDGSSDSLNHKSVELSHSETNSANVIAEKNLSDLNINSNSSKLVKDSSSSSINKQYDEIPVQINETAKEISDSGDAITPTDTLEIITDLSKPIETKTMGDSNAKSIELPFNDTKLDVEKIEKNKLDQSSYGVSDLDSNYSINAINIQQNDSLVKNKETSSELSDKENSKTTNDGGEKANFSQHGDLVALSNVSNLPEVNETMYTNFASDEEPNKDIIKDEKVESIINVTENLYSTVDEKDLNIADDGIITQQYEENSGIISTVFEYVPGFYYFIDYFNAGYVNIFNIFSSLKNENVNSENQFYTDESLNYDNENRLFEEINSQSMLPERIKLSIWGEEISLEKESIRAASRYVVAVIVFLTMTLLMFYNCRKSQKQIKLENQKKYFYNVINKLESKLLVASKEIVSLQDKLDDLYKQEQMDSIEKNNIERELKEENFALKSRISELEEKISYLEKELENISTSALEMHKLLENSLVTQVNSKTTEAEIDILRTLTETQEDQLQELKKDIESLTIENQCLKEDNETIKTSLKNMEKECNGYIKKSVDISEKNRNLTLQLEMEIENKCSIERIYKAEIYQLKSKLEDLEINLKRSEFEIQELNRALTDKEQGNDADEILSYDLAQFKIQVITLEAVNNDLTAQLKEEKSARRMLEEHVGDVTKELNILKNSYQVMEKERNEVTTKLQVLTDYFREKESELHKALETKEKLHTEYESKDQLLSQKLNSLREEINNLKTQNEDLKKEIQDQESSYKLQLAIAEQKTREHWFALRQAERKYKESQQEGACLRNKILLLESNVKSNDKINSSLNGDISSSMIYHSVLSPETLPYHSSPEFIPPPPSPISTHSVDFFPPEPLYSPDERLPPLGGRRAPTPPPVIPIEDEFIPPPPLNYIPARNRNTEQNSMAPLIKSSSPSTRHRTQLKTHHSRSSIDSPSSGVSVESLDKSGR